LLLHLQLIAHVVAQNVLVAVPTPVMAEMMKNRLTNGTCAAAQTMAMSGKCRGRVEAAGDHFRQRCLISVFGVSSYRAFAAFMAAQSA
jgi:hypothetical protein